MRSELILEVLKMALSSDPQDQNQNESIGASIIGKYVICRSRNEGINAGYVEALDNTGVVLTQARRIWYHKPKNVNMSWYEGVANSGLSEDSKVSCTCDRKVIIEDYSLTECSEESRISIMGKTPNAQN